MKLRKLLIFQNFIECKIMVSCPRRKNSSSHFFVSRSRSVARRARVQSFVCVCCVLWCVWRAPARVLPVHTEAF